jgi:hypothetical protein
MMNIFQRSTSNKLRAEEKDQRRPMVFVFGSNKAGIHGRGAARYALLKHGAVMGQGLGHHGNSYAVPTKGQPGSIDKQRGIGFTLSLIEIQQYVDDFIRYARQHPELDFQVTQLGCGLAGLKAEWVAPMFLKAPENCYFDTEWRTHLPERAGDPYRFWGTF